MLTIDDLLEQLRTRSDTVPQPEGREVADAYRDGRLQGEAMMLHVIAVLLNKAREADRLLRVT